ncbi:ribose-phosphate pyrophosphokinase [Mycoplasma zalophi]|uniref:Ribose-phosphate pyrophosphokinase n=1 Tax=Mycoplasma zalophi TaxID=191287 RepID=A0ABS6DP41_9MOLU|nr:ribose-phosphate pyrophosphokinase [Mycoplasma zalophi]MBU4691142.1 ribose-phosphate pyrophosphokinase [Mycoplasma zalophi]MBU4692086.1 ribose-phosphate pyrophosphokinase [Mycoplasma zalophi]
MEKIYKNSIIFGMDNSWDLAEEIGQILELEVHKPNKITFSDGETLLSSDITVRNLDTYIICNTGRNVHDNLMELLIFIDSLKRASAKTINVVMTYYGYARQDRKADGRQPITAKLVADLLEVAGITKLTTVDLHNSSIQGFFNVSVDDLRAQLIFSEELRKRNAEFTVVSPDHGGAVRARTLSELISNDVKIAIIDKRRTAPNVSEVMGVLGDVQDKNVVIIDDIIDTGGTIIKAAKTLKENGAKDILVAATHGIFSKGFEMFENEESIKEVIITNSMDIDHLRKFKKIKILSLGFLLAHVIKQNINRKSLTEIYNAYKDGNWENFN